MPKFYEESTLKRLQSCELEILKDFIKVCEENNLVYFGFSGTAIGAVRHGGFIPWDDDIDVAIPRTDYDKLISVFKRDFSDKYYILNAKECDNYPLMTTRICIKNSAFIETPFKHIDAPFGIFLDVYPLDTPPSNEKKRRQQQRTAFLLNKILILKHCPFPVVPFKGFMKKVVHSATWCVWALLNIFRVSHKTIYNKAITCGQRYNGEQSDSYVWLFSQKCGTCVYPKSDIFPLKKFPFEDTEICLMNKYDNELQNFYGDYMKLPPVEKRKTHYPYILKFPEEKIEV